MCTAPRIVGRADETWSIPTMDTLWPASLLPIFIKFYRTQPHPLVYILSYGCFHTITQSWVVVTETLCPTELKTFTTWPFKKKSEWCSHSGKQYRSSSKTYRISIWSSNPTSGYIFKSIQSRISKRFLHTQNCSIITRANVCKQLKCPSTDKGINKTWYTHTMEYYTALKTKGGSRTNDNTEEPWRRYAR